jgi:hypothetical protein
MTATLLEARQGIADVLRLVDGIGNVYDYIPASPSPPCAIVLWPEIWNPDIYLGGSTAWQATIPVQVLLQTGSNDSADRALGALLEPSGGSSLVEAFDDNADLNDLLHGYAIVRTVTDIGMVAGPDEATRFLSATFNLDVHTT